jgi:thiol-disulfide isomerase/thioredoxin
MISRRDVALAIAASALCTRTAFATTPLDLHALLGQVIYLDFWASWCTPCRESFPWMQSLQNTYRAQGLSIVAINLDHDRSDAERFLRRFPVDFPVLFDPKGTLAEQFKVAGMPTSMGVDRHGALRFAHIGFRSEEQEHYEEQIRELLAEK